MKNADKYKSFDEHLDDIASMAGTFTTRQIATRLRIPKAAVQSVCRRHNITLTMRRTPGPQHWHASPKTRVDKMLRGPLCVKKPCMPAIKLANLDKTTSLALCAKR